MIISIDPLKPMIYLNINIYQKISYFKGLIISSNISYLFKYFNKINNIETDDILMLFILFIMKLRYLN